MVLTIRPAQAQDLPEATVMLNAIIAQGGTTAIEKPLSAPEVAEWFLIPGPRVWCCHIAEQDGVLLGFQSVGISDKLPKGWGEMGTYARIGQTQKGIGSALFAATKPAVKALGLTHLNALIRDDNSGGLAYYTRMGFADDRPAAEVTLKSGQVIARVDKRFAL